MLFVNAGEKATGLFCSREVEGGLERCRVPWRRRRCRMHRRLQEAGGIAGGGTSCTPFGDWGELRAGLLLRAHEVSHVSTGEFESFNLGESWA